MDNACIRGIVCGYFIGRGEGGGSVCGGGGWGGGGVEPLGRL